MVKIKINLSWNVFLFILVIAFTAKASVENIRSVLRHDILEKKGADFSDLLESWEKRFGTQAVPHLVQLASEREISDSGRYIALMASAKLGGPEIVPWLLPFLKDEIWLVRTAALRSLAILKNSQSRDSILPLLKDKALVVRLEAIEALEQLKPTGAIDALFQVLQDPKNYHQGVAQWVPQRALKALVSLDGRSSLFRLKPLLFHEKDPELQSAVIFAIEGLTESGPRNVALHLKIDYWKKNLGVSFGSLNSQKVSEIGQK